MNAPPSSDMDEQRVGHLLVGDHRQATANVLDAAKRFAAGEGNLKALNPVWDNTFLDQLAANDLDAIDAIDAIDAYTND